MPRQNKVLLGLLGTTLDRGQEITRWERWRPTVALFQHEDLLIDRFELLYQREFTDLANRVMEDIRHASPETEVRGHVVEFEDPWDFEPVYEGLHDFARAYPFDPDNEEYLLHISTGTHVAQICMFLLTEARYFPAALIQTSPPNRSNRDVAGSYRVIDLDLSKYDSIATRFQEEQDEALDFLKAGIATRNAGFNRLIEQIERVAIASRHPLLLTGPTGAGKTQLARRIYELKRARRQVSGRFVEVNCATLRGDGAMSTLFGHIKGAFTGAQRDRPGLLRAADGGLLFLDEIGELGLDEQAMLLRAIESGVFMPLGSDKEVESDFQLIAGTNRDLGAEVRDGKFREDLLARINLWTFRLPGLRERLEDIEPNLLYELDQYAGKIGERVTFNKEARTGFLDFATSPDAAWSGNFRDLNAAITRMATLAPGGRITVEEVEEEIGRLRRSWHSAEDAGEGGKLLQRLIGADGVEQLDRFDRVQLADVVMVCRRCSTLSEAGRLLFAISRTRKKNVNDADRLRKYLARFDLRWQEIKALA
ncbi:MAG: transcriptional regulator [Myxococcales bacterium]|nr:transcriptional regulator [Myxococcales bacterium]